MGLSHRESGDLRVATWCGPKSPPRLGDLTAPQKTAPGTSKEQETSAGAIPVSLENCGVFVPGGG